MSLRQKNDTGTEDIDPRKLQLHLETDVQASRRRGSAQSTVADDELVLPLDAFVRSIGVRRTAPLPLFVGAGASISSGLPSAQMYIREWKRSILLTKNPGLEEQFAELSLPGTRRKIQQWLGAQGCYPPDGADDEYGFYIQQCFPLALGNCSVTLIVH